MQLDYIRREIERMRTQVHRQRGEIRQLQRAGISTTSAEGLLDTMLKKIDELCSERDRLKKEQGSPIKGRVLGGRSWRLASQMVRRKRRSFAVDQSTGRSPAQGNPGRSVLPPRPSDHRLNRPICGSRHGQSAVLPEQALWRRWRPETEYSLKVHDNDPI
jgi:hypothetical protein